MSTEDEKEAFEKLGKSLSERQEEALLCQLAVFQQRLVEMGQRYESQIMESAEMRTKFTHLTLAVGLDPLELTINKNSNKNNHGKRQQEEQKRIGLAVRIIEICQELRQINGGTMAIKEMISRLQDRVGGAMIVNEEEIEAAICILAEIGSEIEVCRSKGFRWIHFAASTSDDRQAVLDATEIMGGVINEQLLIDNYRWSPQRCQQMIREMISEGQLWLDEQGPEGNQYWEPSWISRATWGS